MMHPASDALGAWMSAALDDPAVCDAMKADIRAWFDAGQPVASPWRPDREAVARIIHPNSWSNGDPYRTPIGDEIAGRNRAESLAKADAILALASSQPDSGGVELEALKRAALEWKARDDRTMNAHADARELMKAARAYAASVEQGLGR